MSPTSEKLPMNFITDARTKLKNNGAIFLFSWFIRDAFPSFSWIRLPAIFSLPITLFLERCKCHAIIFEAITNIQIVIGKRMLCRKKHRSLVVFATSLTILLSPEQHENFPYIVSITFFMNRNLDSFITVDKYDQKQRPLLSLRYLTQPYNCNLRLSQVKLATKIKKWYLNHKYVSWFTYNQPKRIKIDWDTIYSVTRHTL